jgi:poly[(R)-3-hydroxyalkanoate] polymerase subunit PhaC
VLDGKVAAPPEPEPAFAEGESRTADQPGVAFDAALLATTLGLVRRPLPLRETAALARRFASHPRELARPLLKLAREGATIARGRSSINPPRLDRRYTDEAWSGNPVFRVLAQGHMAVGMALEELLDGADLPPLDDYRLRLLAVNLVAALGPANFPALNPAAMKAVLDTGGRSLEIGARRFLSDVRTPPHLTARSEPANFALGSDLAATPGAVILRTPVMELIQYEAQTDWVHGEPLLFVPSLVNKYYLTDLAPGRSLVSYAVANGFQSFHISWINPQREHRNFGLDTYIEAIGEAIDVVRSVTGAERTHALGVCAGGQLLAIALAYLAAVGRQSEVASTTMTVAVLDHSEPASPTGLLTRDTIERAMLRVNREGIVDGRRLSTSLAWLRPVDSIWWAWVQRYLLAADIPRIDLFHWSEDTANLPAAMVRDMLELTLNNSLTKPGSLRVMGRPIDLSEVHVPAYLIAGLNDNLTPWRSCYQTARLLGSQSTFVLVTGGHLQAILRPPGGRAAGFRTAEDTPESPDEWLSGSTATEASWWEHWTAWLEYQSSGRRAAPLALGSDEYPVLERAPGRYVRRRLDGAPA